MLRDPRNADDVLPNLNEGEDTEPSLMRFHASYPALSLHDDGVVHIMSRLEALDDRAWMVSVDMKKQTPKGVAFFGNGRVEDPWAMVSPLLKVGSPNIWVLVPPANFYYI